MADSPEPEAKRSCNTVTTLCLLKTVGNLRERYTEDTADVFFVKKQTKERLPAHREVLKVASPVFYKMVSGDWKETEEKEIPAPEYFGWEPFKAAITLLYGEEVEVEESVIPAVYGVAHYYDLRAVMSAIEQVIQRSDLHKLSTVVELCTLAGEVVAEREQEENELIQAAVRYIAQHLEQIIEISESVDITRLSYQTMLMLVQCEHISAEEHVVLSTLNKWIDGNSDVSMNKAQILFSYIHYGTLPYESLVQCRVGQNILDIALDNHSKLSIDRLRTSVAQIMPRVGQKEVLQVYPLVPGLTKNIQDGNHTFSGISTSSAVAVVYSGMQELNFELSLQVSDQNVAAASLVCDLNSLTGTGRVGGRRTSNEVNCKLQENVAGQLRSFKRSLVQVSKNRAWLTLYSDTHHDCTTMSKTANIPFSGPFPWLLSFGLRRASGGYSLTFRPCTF